MITSFPPHTLPTNRLLLFLIIICIHSKLPDIMCHKI